MLDALAVVQWAVGVFLVWDSGPFRGSLVRGLVLVGIFLCMDFAKARLAQSEHERLDQLRLLGVHAVGLSMLLMAAPWPALGLLFMLMLDPLVRYRLWTAYTPKYLDRELVRGRLSVATLFGCIAFALSCIWVWQRENHEGSPALLVIAATLATTSWALGLSMTRKAFDRFYRRKAAATMEDAREKERAYERRYNEAVYRNERLPDLMEIPEDGLTRILRLRFLLGILRYLIALPLGLPLLPIYLYVLWRKKQTPATTHA